MGTQYVLMMIAMAVYLIGMIVLGILFSGKNRSTADFYLGGRRLGPFVTAMSAEASDMSSWLLMGLPGVALATGLPEAFWTALGLGIGTYINWLVVAKRIRIYSQKLGSVTVPDFFSRRYHDGRHVLSVIAALVIIVFFIPYVASGFNACGTLFSSLFNVDYFTAMLISAVVILIYTICRTVSPEKPRYGLLLPVCILLFALAASICSIRRCARPRVAPSTPGP